MVAAPLRAKEHEDMANRYAPLKERLLPEQARLQGELAADSDASDSKGYGNHLADNATQVFDQELDQAMERNLALLLEEVEHALRRLAEGTYGTCERCGRQIPFERLERLPQATICVHCKSELEHQAVRAQRSAAEI
jgi:RNA polymerase-binding protein DksA